jgi:aminopeptidase N
MLRRLFVGSFGVTQRAGHVRLAVHRPRYTSVLRLTRQRMSTSTSAGEAQGIKYRHEYQPLPWAVRCVDMSVDLRSETATVTTKLSLRRLRRDAVAGDLVLDAEDLEVMSVKVGGVHTNNFRLTADALHISDVPRDEDEFLVETVCRIDPAKNTQLSGMYRAGPMILTQCEAEGFRRITPYA